MAKKKLTILAVCGSGVVSASMISQKIEEVLESIGIETELIGLLPNSVESYVDRGGIDFVVTTSPIPGNIKVPVIKGVALMTGFGEDAVLEEIKQTAKDIIEQK
jgi:galactitol PTS system EIIB component